MNEKKQSNTPTGEEEKTIKMPTESQFALSKAKLLKDGGIDVTYEVTEVIGDESYINKYHVESGKDIHPDLKNLFKRLTYIVGRVFNITSFRSVVDSKEFKATNTQLQMMHDFADECLKNIEIRGISLSGTEENIGVIITSIYEVAGGLKTCINTPRIRYATEQYGFEVELESIVSDIEQEVYNYLFKGKKAQLELFGE